MFRKHEICCRVTMNLSRICTIIVVCNSQSKNDIKRNCDSESFRTARCHFELHQWDNLNLAALKKQRRK